MMHQDLAPQRLRALPEPVQYLSPAQCQSTVVKKPSQVLGG
jgi:hypothetical protein